MPEASPISLDTDLNESFSLLFADRLHAEYWRVGMCANHGNWVPALDISIHIFMDFRKARYKYSTDLPFLANSKREDG